ncbi:hypothetical protein [Streptomyces lancefieldiae]|uniref:Uncharacterized protein n=1 Tax=Streptomyces lancefieldiae TaxID=3075520 RepID=A0ABU3AXT5_9ACTN|nr:hypothetical protein [Streptomyces sp. DSM 40712]MDT0614992.1 hypothetical protein [Streptomyces sp. DSM 40712]
MGKWFVAGHDLIATDALRAVEDLRLPLRLMSLGFGPDRSVVQMAAALTGWVPCPGCACVGTSAAHTCAVGAPVDDRPPAASEPGLEQTPGPVPPGPVAAPLAESGAAQGRLLPGADDPTWEAVPLHLRQQLRGPAHDLVSPARGPLAARENRTLLSAVRAASRMRMTGAHWIVLLTADRKSFGSPRSQRAELLYEVLEQVAVEQALRAGKATS